jgi:hypothetical protein
VSGRDGPGRDGWVAPGVSGWGDGVRLGVVYLASASLNGACLNGVGVPLDSDPGLPHCERGRRREAARGRLKGLLRTLTNYRVAMASIASAVLGIILLGFEAQTEGAVSSLFGGRGATVLSLGLVVLVYELWLRRSIFAEFLGAAGLEADLAATGIREVRQWGAIDWTHSSPSAEEISRSS